MNINTHLHNKFEYFQKIRKHLCFYLTGMQVVASIWPLFKNNRTARNEELSTKMGEVDTRIYNLTCRMEHIVKRANLTNPCESLIGWSDKCPDFSGKNHKTWIRTQLIRTTFFIDRFLLELLRARYVPSILRTRNRKTRMKKTGAFEVGKEINASEASMVDSWYQACL